jgi:hypothetical protein
MRLKFGLKRCSFRHQPALSLSASRDRGVLQTISAFDLVKQVLTVYDDAVRISGRRRPLEPSRAPFHHSHSTRTIVELDDLLRESGVDHLVDVRSMPRSRTNPQFNGESLPETLAPW